MRKIYSLMLIAAGLLIGTQVWAGNSDCTVQIGDNAAITCSFEGALELIADAAKDNDESTNTNATITLLQDVQDVTFANIQNQSLLQDGDKTDRVKFNHGERITIDLNGKTLKSHLRMNFYRASIKLIGIEGSKVDATGISQFITVYGNQEDANASYDYCTAYIDENVIWSAPADGHGLAIMGVSEKPTAGIRVDVHGQIIGGTPLATSGNSQQTVGNIPQIYIHKTARLVGSHELRDLTSSEKSSAENKVGLLPDDYKTTECCIYAPGYCHLYVSGYVEGGMGIYIKGGMVDIDGAIIKATAAEYHAPIPYGNGCVGAGSAIVLDSHDGYAQLDGVSISNSIVTSDAGYAIEEAATSGLNKLPDINVTSGVFKGEMGSITTTQAEREKLTDKTEGGITGGEWHNSDVNIYINQTINQTLVYKDADQKEYKIVVPKVFPTINNLNGDTVKLDNGNEYSIGENETITISGMLFLTGNSTIVVRDGGVLNVGTLIISDGTDGDHSSVTVEPGGKLFVTGNQGVFSRDANCIIIKADATSNGLFLIAPEIVVNTHPLATVECFAHNVGKAEIEEDGYYWDRIGMPVNHVMSLQKSITAGLDIRYWNYGPGGWKSAASLNQLAPFDGYEVSPLADKTDVTITVKGDMVGNASSKIAFHAINYNVFANSYTGKVDLKAMLTSISSNPNVMWNIWKWENENQVATAIVLQEVLEGTADFTELAPMETFILNQQSGSTPAIVDIDYTNAVWNFNKGVPTPVAARKMNGNADTYAKVIITAANGQSDRMSLREGNDYSDAFDNGAEATKIMSDRNINLYVTTDFAEMASVATDNILGTTLNIQTRDEMNYTMSFSNVRGEQYAIQDVETGVITNIEEGATYDFVAPANETVEGRFVVVAPRATPTNLQNAHVGANVMKTMQNGRLMIIKNGRCFDAMGVNVK